MRERANLNNKNRQRIIIPITFNPHTQQSQIQLFLRNAQEQGRMWKEEGGMLSGIAS